MSRFADSPSEIPVVRISRNGAPAAPEPAPAAPCLARPLIRLGAASPFGLALPDASPTASTMYAPRGVWLDEKRLVVCDSGNHRILIWHSVPDADDTPADVVLGQPDFASEGPAAGRRGPDNGVHLPVGVIVVDDTLIVADSWHHRILFWNGVPEQSDTPPDFVLGQPSVHAVETNRGDVPSRSGFYWPYGIAWIDDRFYVTDTGNRRVLIWDGLPQKDRPADVVLGQPDDQSVEENRGGSVGPDSFRWPHDVTGWEGQLLVADAGNHRLLGWRRTPQHDEPADFLLGQDSFTTADELPYGAPGSQKLRFPYAADVCGRVLAVADTANNRIVFWRMPVEQTCSAPAMDVIGQTDFAGNGENRWDTVDSTTLCWPYGISFHEGILAVADSGNNRVVLWDCREILEYAEAAGSGGDLSVTTGSPNVAYRPPEP